MRLLCVITVAAAIAAASGPVAGEVREIRAARIEQAPKLDGVLDDACWQRAPDATDFYYPETGSRATEDTDAWICCDQSNIYVGFRCHDRQPDKIVAQQRKRGGSIRTDDWVGLDVDPWHSHRSIYWFDVTPRGTQSEEMPGSGGSKIEWLGDWQGTAQIDGAGWTAEMAIPWAILKYPELQSTMGVAFVRRHSRSNQTWFSPHMGPNFNEALMYDWAGLEPPAPKLHGIGLYYTNVGLGGVAFKNGLDIKRQLSQETNALLTINPDFASVEQDVESIDFTYSPRVLTDNRPFFEEGVRHFDDESLMFYSRSIEQVDAGAKIAGQTGRHDFSGLTTTAGANDRHTFYKSRWNINKDSSFGLAATDTTRPGIRNRVGAFHFTLGKETEKRHDLLEGGLLKSWTSGPGRDGMLFGIGTAGHGGPHQFGYSLLYSGCQPDYYPADGIVPDPDYKGWQYGLNYGNEYDKGLVRGWWTSLSSSVLHLHSGDLLSRGISLSLSTWSLGSQVYVGFRRGARREESPSGDGTFVIYRDRLYLLGCGWNQNDMYRRGYLDLSFGHRAGGRSFHTAVTQRTKLTDGLSMDLAIEYLNMTGPYAARARQSVASLAYDISSEQSLSARLVERSGTFNLTFGFRRRVRSGQDVYLLFGDPNADNTKNRVILKLVRPVF